MLKIHIIEDVQCVNSLEFYRESGLYPTAYSRWVKSQIFEKAQKNTDFFYPRDRSQEVCHIELGRGNPKHKSREYLVTLEYAKTLTYMINTKKSKALRTWINARQKENAQQ